MSLPFDHPLILWAINDMCIHGLLTYLLHQEINDKRCHGNFVISHVKLYINAEFHASSLSPLTLSNIQSTWLCYAQASQAQNMLCMRELVYIQNCMRKSPIVKKIV